MDRRAFLLSLAAAGAAAGCATLGPRRPESDAIGEVLPRRPLGRTGERVTMLGLGGFHIGWTTERDSQEVIEAALEGGVRFFDTAENYSAGLSEERFGRYLVPRYRDECYIMTKTMARDGATAREHLEGSLRRLGTDHVDLWQIHSIMDPEDVDARLDAGVLDALLEAKASGKARHIGFTGHRQPAAHARLLERVAGDDPFDASQLPINMVDAGAAHSFAAHILPTHLERGHGVIAMKTLADGRFFAEKRRLDRIDWQTDNPVIPDRVAIQEALDFAWSLPIAVLVTGCENAPMLRENIESTKRFARMDEAERRELVARVADFSLEGTVEYYKHV